MSTLARRLIPCLDVKNGRVVKGVNFVGLRDAGDPVDCARAYDRDGADEITFLDITATHEGRDILLDVVSRTADAVFVPLTVGGGIRARADVDAILRAITDRIRVVPGGAPVHYPDFMFQYREAANFPWRSQAAWLYAQMVRWDGRGFDAGDAAIAAATFRPDLYRAALAGSGAPLPGASWKLEGALGGPIGAGSTQGRLMLGSDRFFDERSFDPDDIPGYLAGLP